MYTVTSIVSTILYYTEKVWCAFHNHKNLHYVEFPLIMSSRSKIALFRNFLVVAQNKLLLLHTHNNVYYVLFVVQQVSL